LRTVAWLALALAAVTWAAGQGGKPHGASCEKVVLIGEVNTGQEWRAAIGQGWVFRVLPIQPGQPGYSGWDLAVDRKQPGGFPDALLLATPPYASINEREVGTTFGLRAQDAIGWNPRAFRFLATPTALIEGQKLYRLLNGQEDGVKAVAAKGLMALQRQAAAGEFRILDAHLAPGVSDAAPYAENWALASARTPHTAEPPRNGKSQTQGELHWMRFSITLWLPGNWRTPSELHAGLTACPQ